MKNHISITLLAVAVAVGLFTSVTAEEWKTIKLYKSSEGGRKDVWAKEKIKLEKGDRLDVVQVLIYSSGNNLKYKIWQG